MALCAISYFCYALNSPTSKLYAQAEFTSIFVEIIILFKIQNTFFMPIKPNYFQMHGKINGILLSNNIIMASLLILTLWLQCNIHTPGQRDFKALSVCPVLFSPLIRNWKIFKTYWSYAATTGPSHTKWPKPKKETKDEHNCPAKYINCYFLSKSD